MQSEPTQQTQHGPTSSTTICPKGTSWQLSALSALICQHPDTSFRITPASRPCDSNALRPLVAERWCMRLPRSVAPRSHSKYAATTTNALQIKSVRRYDVANTFRRQCRPYTHSNETQTLRREVREIRKQERDIACIEPEPACERRRILIHRRGRNDLSITSVVRIAR